MKATTAERVILGIGNITGLYPSKIKPESTSKSLQLDSLDEIELIMYVERFLLDGCHIQTEQVEKFKTVQDIVDYVEGNL